jgi:hypothetical protein
MRNAPSVMFPVGRCVLFGVLLALLAGLGASALGAWWWLDARASASWLGLAGTVWWLIWVVFAVWTWRHSPVGQLRWSALGKRDPAASPGVWHWHSVSCPEGAQLQRVELMVDLQGFALLRLHNADALARWIWVEHARHPAHWNDLRRALVSGQA